MPNEPSFAGKTLALARPPRRIDWKRIFFLGLGLFLLFLFTYMPTPPPAVDPLGKSFTLSHAGQGAIGVFLMAGVWWIFEVMPIGVVALSIGIAQALFGVRSAAVSFKDFTDPSVMFILGSLLVGLSFTKSGLTRRVAYKTLVLIGENTRMILLGCFVVTALLSHLMAHTAVAATMFPVLMAIRDLYDEDDKPSRFGKALFIGMAYVAGAGSVCTLLGSARGVAALGMFKEFTGADVSFVDYSLFLMPVGWVMAFLLWGMLIVFFPPEKARIEGLREQAKELYETLGPMNPKEKFVILAVATAILFYILQAFWAPLRTIDRSIPVLLVGVLFFATNLMSVEDLEKSIPWNIFLLFGGAMSIGFALWQTGAAQWMAVHWLSLFKEAHWLVFIVSIATLVLILTNFIMNVAAIAITLPVSLVIAKYLGVNPYVVLWVALLAAGMPFLLLIGAAPNAIAYNSKQFTTGEFLAAGVPASIILLVVIVIALFTLWPLMGLTPLLK